MPEPTNEKSDAQDPISILLSEIQEDIKKLDTECDKIPYLQRSKLDFRQHNPDQWVMLSQKIMRSAAINIMDWRLVRTAFCSTIAMLLVALREGDKKYGKNIIVMDPGVPDTFPVDPLN